MGDAKVAEGAVAYIPLLDGVRAVSIGLVIVSHLVIYNPNSYLAYKAALASGYTGVSVFFVLSGYLITTLLLREEERSGQICLSSFYLRRMFRILPAAYCFLVVLIALAAMRMVKVPFHDFASSFLYIRNFVGQSHETAHLWSLAIEEQFYLLWPLFLLYVAPQHRIRAVAVIIGSICAWRSLLTLTGWASVGALYSRTDLRLDSILMGCLLALLCQDQRIRHAMKNFISPELAILAGILGLVTWKTLSADMAHGAALDSTLTAGVIALSLYGLLYSKHPACVVLETKTMAIIGKLSYGIYLWQQLFFGPPNEALSAAREFPTNLVLTVAMATISYHLVEKPFLRLRERFVT